MYAQGMTALLMPIWFGGIDYCFNLLVVGSNFLTRNDVTKDVDFRNSKEQLDNFRVISLSWRVPSSLSSCLVCSAMSLDHNQMLSNIDDIDDIVV